MPLVTVQVVPAVAHPANASEFIIADSAAYAEHVVGGYVFTDTETVSALAIRFDSLRAESYLLRRQRRQLPGSVQRCRLLFVIILRLQQFKLKHVQVSTTPKR
jgi:hypothetical protein